MILSHAVARETGYWVHVVVDLNTISSSNMVKLGLCTADLDVTPLGYKCLERDMDISGTLLVEVGIRLGVGDYAKVAAAFLNSGVELFSNAHAGVKQVIALTAEQRDLASKYGDVHTAVKWFLKWCPKLSLPDHLESLFNIMCFRKMHAALYRKRGYFALPIDGEANYEMRMLVAIAFAKQRSIVCRHGNTCVTSHMDKDERRENLAFLNAEVKISERSVCYMDEMQDNPSWLVYVSTGRYPFVKSVTVLPTNIAAWFSHFRFRQENEIDFARAFICLLEDPDKSASLAEFVSLLDAWEATDKGNATDVGVATSVDTVDLDMPRKESGATNINSAALSSTQSMHLVQDALSDDAGASTVALATHACEMSRLDVSVAPALPCSHELLKRVHEIVRGDFVVDSSDLVQILKAIGSAHPHLARDANMLAESFMREAAPSYADTSRKDLVVILKFLLRGRLDAPNFRRQIKTFAFNMQVDMLKSLGEKNYLSLADQEDLLAKALLCGCTGGGVSNEYDSEGALQVINSLSTHIAALPVTRGRAQVCSNKAKKRVNKSRQMVFSRSGHHSVSFVTHDDVIAMVMDGGVTDEESAHKCAQYIWDKDCYTLEVYLDDDGTRGTQAEFVCQWLDDGYTLAESVAHLSTLTSVFDGRGHPKKRSRSPNSKRQAMKRARQKVSMTYSPKDASGRVDEGDAS